LEKMGVGKIIVDPGIGFGKSPEHNLALLRGLETVALLGYPVMVGASRKSFIGRIVGADTGDRLAGSLAAHIWSVLHGASVVRVHDVAAHRQAFDVIAGIGGKRTRRGKKSHNVLKMW
jgi:dihydropteroate synthase